MILVLSSLSPASASEARSCIIQALQVLQSSQGQLLSQSDVRLAQRGLIPPGSASALCGAACATHVLQAVRKALGKDSLYASSVDEIEALTKVGFLLGENVPKQGMSLFSLKAALEGDLRQHHIQAKVIGVTLDPVSARGDITWVRDISFSDFKVSPVAHTAVIALIHDTRLSRESTGHYVIVEEINRRDSRLRFVDPQNPERKNQGFIVPTNRGRQSTLLLTNGLPQDSGWRVDGLIRIELESQ